MILNALVEKLKRRSKDDFKGRHYEATLILQAVSWYLRYPLSYRDIEELFLERGLEVVNRTGFLGGVWAWITRRGRTPPFERSSALRLRPAARCRWARAVGGG